jgi:hypothetical protein
MFLMATAGQTLMLCLAFGLLLTLMVGLMASL